jgi:hypothetical protein
MSPALWIFASISLVIAILLFLFWYFCSSNIYTKSISTILVILAGLGGSKVAPEYKASFKLNHPILTFDGAISVGGKGTDSIILICVLGIALLVLVSCVTILK